MGSNYFSITLRIIKLQRYSQRKRYQPKDSQSYLPKVTAQTIKALAYLYTTFEIIKSSADCAIKQSFSYFGYIFLLTKNPRTRACIFLSLYKPSFFIVSFTSNYFFQTNCDFCAKGKYNDNYEPFALFYKIAGDFCLLLALIDASPAKASSDRLFLLYFYIRFIKFYIDKQMSYGWLTQSALLPKKSKPIKVEDEGSLFGLKTILMKEKEKIASNIEQKPKITKKSNTSKNKGIEERMRRDELLNSEDKKVHQAQKILKKKTEIYSELEKSKKNVGKLLVDFTQKSLLNNEDDQFEKNKQLFYSGKLQELKRQRDEVQNQHFGEQDVRERLAWEKQVLDELKGDFQQKQKVKQVFDRKLQKQQKDALNQIRKQLSAQQRLIQQAKKRRQQIKAQRTFKLNKLNSINKIQEKKQAQILQLKLNQQRNTQKQE